MSGTLAQRLQQRDAERFVGRDRELAFFDSLFTDDPPAQIVHVHGPGGIGKSTLLREVARRGARRGWHPHVVEGRELAPVPGEIEAALGDLGGHERPLLLFDTYERMSAADGWLRARLVPSLPARAIVVLAGRQAPAPDWFRDGWERLTVELDLAPFGAAEGLALLQAHGLADEALSRQIIAWADGSPLALSLAADAARRDGGSWDPERMHEQPNLVQAILHRLARTELDRGNLEVAAVAAIVRSCNRELLADVLPDVDPDAAYRWLQGLSFAEHVGDGIALHELVRQAITADLRTTRPERDRELRCRIADHHFARGRRIGTRVLVDLVDLVRNPAIRWGFGADGSTTHRPDLWRPEDAEVARARFEAKPNGPAWWAVTEPLLEQMPERVVTVRDAHDQLVGMAIAVTPENAPAAAEDDICLGPWLRHAREAHAGEEVLIWRDSLDFAGHGDATSPVLSILNTAAILRSGLRNPRWSYIPIDPDNPAAIAFAEAVGTTHLAELDVRHGGRLTQCHLIDHDVRGILGGIRSAIYDELGLPEGLVGDGPAGRAVDAEAVRDALRNVQRPLELANNPLARGDAPDERAASVRAELEDALVNAFGDSADEQLMRQVVERGYLDPAGSHEQAADALHVSRATYFRRLRVASQRISEYLVAKHGVDGDA